MKHKRHFGKSPDWLAWIHCKRTACTKRRETILEKLIEVLMFLGGFRY